MLMAFPMLSLGAADGMPTLSLSSANAPTPDATESKSHTVVELGANGLPADQAACFKAMHASPGAYTYAGRLLGISDEQAFRRHERVTLWRQVVARRLPGVTNAQGTHDSMYFIVPKVAHTTIVGHLLGAGPFNGSGVAWDAAHPAPVDTASLLIEGEKSRRALEELTAARPFEWTVVRNPLDHFMAGFDQVEFNLGAGGMAKRLHLSGEAEGSAWVAAYASGASTAERATAMLADFLAVRGPKEYLSSLCHITPQTLGFARERPLTAPVGTGFQRLHYVGHMEELDDAWSRIQEGLGIRHPAPVTDHVNAQKQRRAETSDELREEVGLLWGIDTKERPSSNSSALHDLSLLFEDVKLAGKTPLSAALCSILSREFKCLGYALPKHCA